MMELNFLKALFAFMTIFIVVIGNLVNFLEDKLPSVIAQSFRYGKFSYVGKTTITLVEIPKSWFKHFYIFSSLLCLYALYVAIDVYLYNANVSQNFVEALNFLGGSTRKLTVDPLSVLICFTLMALQSIRRFYETWFVSVFSKGKMNLSHYLVGFIHYWGAICVVFSEAQGFGNGHGKDFQLHWTQLSIFHIIGIATFTYAWYYQFQCAIILANLRKDSQGRVVSEAHKVPMGGLFDVLSSPHLTCEVLIYLGLTIVLRQSSTFPFVFIWVLSNQVEVAFLNHWWYKKNFKNYPKTKKAFIPYVI